ncbi:MAG: SAM-dependent methyltransferase [Desulfobacterales bacterium]|nr:SAM-dependent methyltransferase [Desulfobacterales bacterium]
MSSIDPRKMALQIAGFRAGESQLPEDERVFYDPYAECFFSDEEREHFKDVSVVRTERAKYEAVMPGVPGAMAARVRFLDELLKREAADGLQQLVIIGAGYDTRAYRFEEVKEGVAVFEVDHPMTQAVKVDVIRKIFGALPDHVTYTPVIFGEERLDEKLIENGYDPGRKTLFILEGLTMYIPPPAMDGLLQFIVHASGPGSALAADCFSKAVVDGTSPLKEARVLRQFVENEGSQLMFGIEETEMEAFFENRGFHPVTALTPDDCKEKYFRGVSKNRTVSKMFTFVHAVVNSRA